MTGETDHVPLHACPYCGVAVGEGFRADTVDRAYWWYCNGCGKEGCTVPPLPPSNGMTEKGLQFHDIRVQQGHEPAIYLTTADARIMMLLDSMPATLANMGGFFSEVELKVNAKRLRVWAKVLEIQAENMRKEREQATGAQP